VISFVLAFFGALVNATGNVLNRKAARDEPAQVQFRLRLFIDLAHRKAWLAAVGMMILSFALAAAALGTGQLASVQLVVILELPMTIIGGSWLFGTRLGKREWVSIAAMTLGVIGLLALLEPRPGPAKAITPILWILTSAANGGLILVLFLAAKAHPRTATRACLLGLAAGCGYGLTAAYTKGMADEFISRGITGVLTSWQIYATVTAGVVSSVLLENAYQAGPLTASQPGITLVDPLISTLWGVVVFGELVNRGALLALTPVPLIAVAAGVFLLSRSPILHATQAGPAEAGQPAPAAVTAAGQADQASNDQAAAAARRGGAGS
jgi:drug/metabolite transporter (DMT)-like permease